MRPCDEAKAVERMPRSSRDAGKSHGGSMPLAELTWPRRRLDLVFEAVSSAGRPWQRATPNHYGVGGGLMIQRPPFCQLPRTGARCAAPGRAHAYGDPRPRGLAHDSTPIAVRRIRRRRQRLRSNGSIGSDPARSRHHPYRALARRVTPDRVLPFCGSDPIRLAASPEQLLLLHSDQ
jgi:hypothetical protein